MTKTEGRTASRGKRALLAIISVGLAYSIVWFAVSVAAQSVMEDWRKVSGNDRLQLSFSRMETGGFPFSVRLTLSDAELLLPRYTGKAALRSPKLVASISLWRPLTVSVDFPDGADYQARYEDFHSDFNYANLAGSMDTLQVTASLALDTAPTVSSLRLHAVELQLPSQLAPPYPSVTQLEFNLEIAGSLPATLSSAGLGDWRDNGGAVPAFDLSLDYGDLSLVSTGALTLDEQLRPTMDSQIELYGFNAFADVLGRTGLYSENNVMSLKGVFQLVANKDAGSDRPVIRLPITVKNGIAYAGHLPVARFGAES